MDQWKLILQALFLTMLLPLLLWTGLFAVFGWKLFLFLFAGVGLLFMFGDKLIQQPLFQSVVRMLLPFAMTFRFYAALKAGKEVREQEGSSTQAWWATFQQLLAKQEKDNEEASGLPEKQEAEAKSKRWWKTKETPSAPASQTAQADSKFDTSSVPSPPARAELPPVTNKGRPSEEELDDMLVQLKAKMEREKERE